MFDPPKGGSAVKLPAHGETAEIGRRLEYIEVTQHAAAPSRGSVWSRRTRLERLRSMSAAAVDAYAQGGSARL